MSQPAPRVLIAAIATCGSRCTAYFLAFGRLLQTARMRVRLEIQLAPPAIGYVRVQLRRREIGMPEHLLDGA